MKINLNPEKVIRDKSLKKTVAKEKKMAKKLTKTKAKEILKHGTVHGKPLTEAQKGFMGARAGGQPVKRKK